MAGDLERFGRALGRNVAAQAELHPSVVSDAARAVGELADAVGALGWKVNGAGGDGGSVAILFAEDVVEARAAFAARLARAIPAARLIPVRLADRGAGESLV